MTSLENMFFSFRFAEQSGESFVISRSSAVVSDTEKYACTYLKNTVSELPEDGEKMEIQLISCIPDELKARLGDEYKDHKENYAVEISRTDGTVKLYATTHRGLIYAVSTLRQLIRGNAVKDMLLFDYPDKNIRGYRVYTPGRKFIPTFKKMIDDMLVNYKYNAMIIEIGGAMEYKRRPEINKRWVEFCDEVSVSPEVAGKIQGGTYPWAKNSIHFDNGNGGFITQDEMRDIIAYCREREIEVYPEVPSLSHSDYICMTYPELKERKEDAYPDSYCPSNPKTYEVLFDIIDEVVDVFQPEYLNIGHDEYYSSAKCPKCRNKRPVDLYVEDIIKINDYLKTKNVKALMWCDKMLENIVFIDDRGNRHIWAGAADPHLDIPALFECKGRIPKDITMIHWYWTLADKADEREIYDLGYKMLFGNYSAVMLDDYRERSAITDGGFVSNWGSCEYKYMQRNSQNYSLCSTSRIFWDADYDDADREKVIEDTKLELYNNYKSTLGEHIIELVHTTDYYTKYTVFYDGKFIVDEDWHIGDHVVTYTDGTVAKLPVIYGFNIRNCDPNKKGMYREEAGEVYGASLPYIENGRVLYKAAYADPYSEKEIASIAYESINGAKVEVVGNIMR